MESPDRTSSLGTAVETASAESQTTSVERLGGRVEWVDGRPHLVGTRCSSCGTHTFPVQAACPRCGGSDVEAVPLPRSGTVWTWTVQRHAPKPPFRAPASFQPFALGYIDLGPLRVESRLDGRACDDWAIGETVELCVGPLVGAPGDDLPWSFWFVPKDGGP